MIRTCFQAVLSRFLRGPLGWSGLGVLACFACVMAKPCDAASVKSFSPQGSVKNISQVVAQFSEALVPMGSSQSQMDPLVAQCSVPVQKVQSRSEKRSDGSLAYTTRWIDGERWSLDFVEALPSGVLCTFRPNPQFKDLKGAALQEAKLSFDTGGPTLIASLPAQDTSADKQQIFLLLLDAEVEEASLLKHAYFEIEDEPGQVPLSLIKGQERKHLLAQEPYHQFLKERKLSIPHGEGLEQGKQILLLKGTRSFPERKRIVLHWDQGIRGRSGAVVSEAQSFGWWIPEDFKARVECQRSAKDRACSPFSDIQVSFTRSVSAKALKGAILEAKGGTSWQARELQTENTGRESGEQELWSLTFPGPLPASTDLELRLPSGLKATDGSALSNQAAFPMALKTDITPPLLMFAAPFGILESKANPVLPVNVRNIEFKSPLRQKSFPAQAINLNGASAPSEIISWLKRVRDKDMDYGQRNHSLFDEKTPKESFSLPTPMQPSALNLVGIPLPKPGFHVVEIESPALGAVLTGQGPMYVASAALVTDIAVHLKVGRESSLVWATQLSTGKPLAKAEVALFNGKGKELHKGVTDEKGLWKLPQQLLADEATDNDYEAREIFAFAKVGEDISFVSSRWTQGIETYRFNVANEYLNPRWGPALMHSVLDRVTVQPGETVNMKHVLREHVGTGFASLKKEHLPLQVLLMHQGSQQVYALPFEWDAKTGTALNSFKVPPEAKLGTYNIYLSASPKRKEAPSDAEQGQGSTYEVWGDRLTGSFRVAEYRLPLVDAQVKIQGQSLVAPSEVKVDLSASYLSGGPAQGLKSKLRSMLVGDEFRPETPESSGMNFFSAPLQTGLFDSYYGYIADGSQGEFNEELAVQDLTLDKQGGTLATIKGLKSSPRYRKLRVEWEYKDPNGEIRTARSDKALFPASAAVGIEAEQWFVEAGKARVKGLIIDVQGKPLAKRPYKLEAFSNTYITHRKKLAGGFYSYDSKVEVKSLGVQCEGESDAQGQFFCELPKLQAGEYSLQASTMDEQKRRALGRASLSVYSKGVASWYPSGDSDRMDIIPERAHYEPGEKAKIIVRTPYTQSQVLVTVEREGILDAYVSELSRDKPFVEIPIKGHYAPNVFVSVLSVRGRVADPQPTALIDLAKPSLKMGLTSLKVGWQEHKLDVEVSADKKVYQARDKVQVHIKVKDPSGRALPQPTEVAVVAVDEALLKLKANDSWDLLAAMMRPRSLAVETSTGQLQVIGRRHFGLKAQAPGGGGGQGPGAREIFDPMLLWSPRVALDAKGEATVSVTLNDAMSSFRLVAIAQAGQAQFGHGSTLIQSTKDLLVLPGFAPLLREGDRIRNSFTVRNTTQEAMQVQVTLSSPEISDLPKFAEIPLGPSEAKVLEVPLTVPEQTTQLHFVIEAKDLKSGRKDTVKVQEKVQAVWAPPVTQATLLQLDKEQSLDVKQPWRLWRIEGAFS